MKRIKILLPIFLCYAISFGAEANVKDGLKVSANRHYLVDAKTNQPVFILATTAWNINALNYAELDFLIESNAKNGFNSIMFALDFYPQATEKNVYGEEAYMGAEKIDLNPAYFSYCDYIVRKCAQYRIYPMLYTMWSGKTTGIMNNYTASQLYTLGKKIGERYKNDKHVILVAGGESTPKYIDIERVNGMGRGLKEGSHGQNLVSVHPCSPHSTSEYLLNAEWVDFWMAQGKSNIAGVSYDFRNLLINDFNLNPAKPTLMVEHRYESGVSEDPIIQRRTMYLSVFSGSFGFAYGHNALWQMTPHTAQKWMLNSWKAGVETWQQALNTPAQQQLRYIKTLLGAVDISKAIPDQSLLISKQADSIIFKVSALRDGDKNQNNATFIYAYFGAVQKFEINTRSIGAQQLDVYVFNPANGTSQLVGKKVTNTGIYEFVNNAAEPDGVLVLFDSSKKYKLLTKKVSSKP